MPRPSNDTLSSYLGGLCCTLPGLSVCREGELDVIRFNGRKIAETRHLRDDEYFDMSDGKGGYWYTFKKFSFFATDDFETALKQLM